MYRKEDLERVRDVLGRHQAEYMFIGRGAAIIQGFSDTTQDIDIYPLNDPGNNRKLCEALREIGFEVSPQTEAEILRGKDFVQLREGPFDLDLIFAPDGFDSYEQAIKMKTESNGFPVLSIEGIILSKRAAGRVRDRESLGRLIQFKEYLDATRRKDLS